jgi:hypothetical protein
MADIQVKWSNKLTNPYKTQPQYKATLEDEVRNSDKTADAVQRGAEVAVIRCVLCSSQASPTAYFNLILGARCTRPITRAGIPGIILPLTMKPTGGITSQPGMFPSR